MTAASSPPPSQAKAKAKPLTLRRALLPLLLLVIPLGMAAGARYLPAPWPGWLDVAAWVVTGAIVCWALVRLILYLHLRWLRHRELAFQRRQDQFLVAGTKVDERIRKLMTYLKNAGLGPYGLSWFMIMGHSPSDTEALLNNSGLSFPPNIDGGLNLSADQLDHWRLANEAIFIDTSASPPDRDDRHWEILAGRLAERRPKEPICGVVLTLDVDQLANDDDDAKDRRRRGTLERLRTLQNKLRLSFPVYLVITGLDRVTGFHEFFGALDEEARNRILGWSAPLAPEQEFDHNLFRRGLADLAGSLDKMMLQRLSAPLPSVSADRIYMFNEEMRGLLAAVREEVEAVFAPNLYLDPLPFRGFYLTGGLGEGPPVSFRPEGGLLSGEPPAAAGGDTFGAPAAWFVRDVFKEKILGEQGLVSRPRHVRRRDLAIKSLTALAAAAALAAGVWWVAHTVVDTRELVSSLEPTLETASADLQGGKGLYHPLDICQLLTRRKRFIARIAWWERLFGAGRYEGLESRLGRIHRACFQELFLRSYLRQVEDGLRYWQGAGDFQVFAEALAEYIRWARPRLNSEAKLAIAPLARFMPSGQASAQEIIAQYQEFMNEGGPSINLVGTEALPIVQHALDQVRNYLNPSIPASPDQEDWARQSQWWLELSLQLEETGRRYRALLDLAPPAASASFEQVSASYDMLVDRLAAFLNAVDAMGDLTAAGANQNAAWVGAEKTLGRLRRAARGWKPVRNQVEEISQAASLYRRRIVGPLKQNIYFVQFLKGRPGYAWLSQILTASLPQATQVVVDPIYQVGPFVLQLLQALGDYHAKLEQWAAGYQAWEEHIASSARIGGQAEILRLEELPILKTRSRVGEIFQEIKDLAGRAKKEAARAAPQGIMARVEAKASGKKSKRGQAEVRQEILGLYGWPQLQAKLPQWLKIFNRRRLYQTSLYWMELEAKFSINDALRNKQDWRSIKGAPIFSGGDAYSLVSPISQFLRDWVQDLPHGLAVYNQPNPKNPPPRELRNFLAMNRSIFAFQEKYLPKLRKAAQQFVACVHDMDLDPARAWSRIWNTPGPGAGGGAAVSWGALKAMSGFRDAFEADNGPVLENLTGALVDVERNVVQAFEEAVLADFTRQWNALLIKYEKLGFAEAFPFAMQGEREISRKNLMDFINELEALVRSFALLQPRTPGKPAGTKLVQRADRLLARMKQNGDLEFVRSCLALKAFLTARGLTKPRQVIVKLIPGDIGRHVHWVRIQLGQGGRYDLNVYGKPPATIPLHAGTGALTYQGLDMNKNPLASLTVTKGDFALLQLPYSWGGTKDPQRKVWTVEGRIPSVAQPGRMIPFQMVMTFSQSLPELPKWPSRR